MTDRQLFCFGYGYVAAALGALLRRKGWHIAGTTTSAEKAASMTRSGVSTHLWRDTGFDTGWLDNTNAILISTPPGEDGCPSLAAAQEDIAAHAKQIQWIGYLSTNGVYGDHDGAWVSEESELRPSSNPSAAADSLPPARYLWPRPFSPRQRPSRSRQTRAETGASIFAHACKRYRRSADRQHGKTFSI